MFEHAYHGYMKFAYPYDELRPLTCDGVDTWGRYVLIKNLDFLQWTMIMFLATHYHWLMP